MEDKAQFESPGDTGLDPLKHWSRYRFVIGALTLSMNFSVGLGFFVVAPITPLIIEDYGVSRSAASLLTGMVMLVQSGFAIPGSMLVGRVPLKWLIALAWVACAAPTLSFLAHQFFILLGLRLVYGLGLAVLFPSMAPLLMRWFPPKELPLINGLNIAVVSGGVALTTFTMAPLAQEIGWKVALSLFSIVPLVGAALWVILGRVPGTVEQGERHLSLAGLWGVIRSRATVLLALGDAGAFAQYIALTTWLPTFYFEVHGLSLNRAGAAVGLLPLTGVFAVLLASLLSLRFHKRRPFLIVSGLFAGIAGFGTFLLAGTVWVYPALILVSIGSWLYIPAFITLSMELPGIRPEEVSVIFAVIMAAGGILTFGAPLVVGASADLLGTYVPGFVIFSILAWSLVVAGLLLPETGGGHFAKHAESS